MSEITEDLDSPFNYALRIRLSEDGRADIGELRAEAITDILNGSNGPGRPVVLKTGSSFASRGALRHYTS